jgi:hypothetical protein
METVRAFAHVITGQSVALGDPAVLIMTPDEGAGARLVERPIDLPRTIGEEAAPDVLWDLPLCQWRRVGEPVTVELGYVVFEVEREV